jgi:4-amino-4-deoxy-L-arabinose transferase-like glycosyltransferase
MIFPAKYSNLFFERTLLVGVLFLFILIVHKGWVGMSMEPDGLIYASVSAHLAEGIGSFWFPYSMFNEPSFHHHPPLAFGLQSLLFSLFGDEYYVENVYQIICLLTVVGLMCGCWRQGARLAGRQTADGRWFLLLLFFSMPIIAQSFTNNYLENTLSVFTLAAVYCLLRIQDKSPYVLSCFLAGFFTVAALLVKGPVGLFPLAVLPIVLLTIGGLLNRAIVSLLIYLTVIFLCFALLFLNEAAKESIALYVNFQLVGTLEGVRPQVHGRSYMLARLSQNLIGPGLLVFGLGIWRLKTSYRAKQIGKPDHLHCASLNRESVLWLLIALSASIPLLVSPRHLSQYIVPSLPFYSLFLASLLRPWLEQLLLRVRPLLQRVIPVVTVTLILLTAIVSWRDVGVIERDRAVIGDMERVIQLVPRGEVIGICVSSDSIYRLLMYLSRHHSIRTATMSEANFIFCDNPQIVPKGFKLVTPGLNTIPLYSRNSV